MDRLTLSDWVTFLTNEKHGSVNTVANVSAILFGFFGLLFAQKMGEGILIVAAVIVLYVLWVVLKPFQTQEKTANRLLQEIMRGELTDPNEIRNQREHPSS